MNSLHINLYNKYVGSMKLPYGATEKSAPYRQVIMSLFTTNATAMWSQKCKTGHVLWLEGMDGILPLSFQ